MHDRKDYAKTIIDDLLKLREGDALSINTDEADLEFAKEIANCAILVTNVTAKIVVTEHGRPTQVLEFDPAPPATDPRTFAMLRIAHERKHRIGEEPVLDLIVDKDDLSAMQKLGHLAEPELLNRRVSVPWCVATVHDEDDERNDEIARKIALNIAEQSLSTDYRRQYLENSDSVLLHITGRNTDFTVKIPENARFVGGTQTLPNGRTFLNGLDFDVLSFITDRNSLDGTFEATATVMGRPYDGRFVFENGKLVDYTHTRELDEMLTFDDNLSRPGYFSFRDKEFVLHMGGSIIEGLDEEPEDEELLPEYFNRSLYTLALNLDPRLSITATDCEGRTTELVRKGFFLQ